MNNIIKVIAVILLFISVSILASFYENELIYFAKNIGSFGIMFYVLTTALAVIIPMWGNLFLIPVATIMWGPFITALLSILGWVIGSQTSFLLGRLFKKRILKMFPALIESDYVERLVSKKYTYTSLILLRMTLPVDILSYALGIFVPRITAYQNFVTSFIGVIPFAFAFSYFNNIPKIYLIGLFVSMACIFFIYSSIMLKNKG